jgi:uncharacterized protein (TIGR03067 family)
MTAALACLLLFPVPPVLSPDAQKELKKIQGKWFAETLVKDGTLMKFRPQRTPYEVEIKGREWNMINDPMKYVVIGIDTKVEPMHLDLKCVAPKFRAGHVEEAIFSVTDNGQTLTLAMALSNSPFRPVELNAPKDGGRYMFVLKRVQEKKDK